jgi:type III pantothenate kinase
MSSVVPQLNLTFAEVCRDYLDIDAIQVTSETHTGIVIKTENPAEVGADRIVNAVAAYKLCAGPAVVVDMGTATTFDAISDIGELLGVAIAPGLGLAAEALASRAAQLGRVALEAPPQAIGRNTVQAMQSGLVFGYVALIDGMVQRFKHELGLANVQVVGTGGMISIITPHTNVIDHVHPWLTLDGLLAIYKLNNNEAAGIPS